MGYIHKPGHQRELNANGQYWVVQECYEANQVQSVPWLNHPRLKSTMHVNITDTRLVIIHPITIGRREF